jgi:hypothetical protein
MCGCRAAARRFALILFASRNCGFLNCDKHSPDPAEYQPVSSLVHFLFAAVVLESARNVAETFSNKCQKMRGEVAIQQFMQGA